MEERAAGLDRRAAVVVLVAATAVLVALAAWLVPWEWVPGGELTAYRPDQLFSRGEIARAESFAEQRRWLGWASYAVSLVVALVLGLTPVGARLLRRIAGRLPWWLAFIVGAAVLLLVGRLVTMPFALALRAQSLDYGLTNQGVGGWLRDQGTSFLVAWVSTSLLFLVLGGCARRWPRRWFVAAGLVAALLTAAGSYLYPVVVEPLFNDFTSMPDSAFRASVLQLAEQEGVEVSDVLVADASRRTTTLNAYVSGFGGTRRVVVYDNLLDSLPADEARAVIAHELAHARHDDVLVGTALGVVGSLAGVALLALLLDSRRLRRWSGTHGPGDPAVVALVLALSAVGSFAASPVINSVSRAIEVRADRDSIAATGNDPAFIAMQRQLALRSLQDPTPPAWSQLWFGSHPTVLQRAGLPASIQEAPP